MKIKQTLGMMAAGMLVSISAHAALLNAVLPYQVVVDKSPGGMDVLLEGLIVQPSGNDTEFATLVTAATGSNHTGDTNIKSINPGWNGAFRLGVGYTFPASGDDMQLNWTHFTANGSKTVRGGNNGNTSGVAPLGFVIDFTNPLLSQAHGKVDYNYDSVDLIAGRTLDFGKRMKMRFGAGLRYATLNRNLRTNMSLPNLISSFEFDHFKSSEHSSFSGIGPRFELDSNYYLGNNIGFIAHLGSSLLVGQTKYRSRFATDLAEVEEGGNSKRQNLIVIDDEINGRSKGDTQNRIVPTLDGRLGFDYTYPAQRYIFNAQLGYAVEQYFAPFSKINWGTLNAFTGNIYADSVKNVDFSYSGPFLNASVRWW